MTARRVNMRLLVASFGLALVLAACGGGGSPEPSASSSSPDATSTRNPEAAVVSAFFGLDDALPQNVNLICPGGAGKDGIVLVFSTDLAPDSLQADDFRVVTKLGKTAAPMCATLAPAIDDEDRTVLLIGDLASAEDPPLAVDVTGSLKTADGTDLQGETSPRVVPLEDGPSISWAEVVDLDPARNDPCPDGTKRVVRV